MRGATAVILESARRLARRGWSVDIYAERLDCGAIKAAQARPHWIPGWPWGSAVKRRLFAAVADRLVARGGFDLIHGHGDNSRQDILSLHNCVEAAHEAICGEPMRPLSGVASLHRNILSQRRFRLLVANSKMMRDEVQSRFGVPPEDIVVIYPGCDLERFRLADATRWRDEARKELGCGQGDILFGLVTSGDFAKRGVTRFIQALGRLAGEGLKLKAVVVGKHSTRDICLKAAQAGLGSSMRFFPPTPLVERYYHALDAYVLPAFYEEFGICVAEALACGLPVITTRRTGASEWLRSEQLEFVLQSPDPEELAAKMRQLALDHALRRRLGALGPLAVRGHGWDDYETAVFECYQRLLGPSQK